MEILVTGGAGFIGGRLSGRLVDLGHKVTVVDDLSTGSLKNIPPQCEFFELDLSINETYDHLPTNFDMVFHLASQVSSEHSHIDPINDIRRNALSTLQLLQWIMNNKIKKLAYTSSMGVYPDMLGVGAKEDEIMRPKSFYGIGKMCSEEYIRIFSEEGLNTTVYRLFNVYGPGQDLSNLKQGIVSIYLSYILKNKPILVKGPLDRVRDFIFIDDVINALLTGLIPESKNQIFNVCSGVGHSIKELLEILIDETNNPIHYTVEILPRTPRDIDSVYGDYSKLNSICNWEPQSSLRSGIKEMISSYKNSENLKS